MNQVTVYACVDYPTFQKIRQALDMLRVQERRRVNQRTFLGQVISLHIDEAVAEIRSASTPEER